MRKFIYALGTAMTIVIVAAGIGLGVLLYKGLSLDAESKVFVDNSVIAIAASWSEQRFLDLATPELRESAKPEELSLLFERLSQLGALVEYEGSTGEATMSYVAGSGGTVTAFYVAQARFENGGATFRIALIKRDGSWRIHNFNADAALDNRAGQNT